MLRKVVGLTQGHSLPIHEDCDLNQQLKSTPLKAHNDINFIYSFANLLLEIISQTGNSSECVLFHQR